MVHYAVIGGGIAGVCCVEELCRLCPSDQVTLVSASSVLKGVANVVRLTNSIEEFQVVERSLTDLAHANLRVIQGCVTSIDATNKVLLLESGERLQYDKLCIAAGARPKRLANHERVVTLRDTESIHSFAERLQGASRIVVVGNGAIALEIVGAELGVEVVWVLKDAHIGDAFFDIDAAQHLLEHLQRQQQLEQPQPQQGSSTTREPAAAMSAPASNGIASSSASTSRGAAQHSLGHAAGPKWQDALPKGHQQPGHASHAVLETNAVVRRIMDWPPGAAADGKVGSSSGGLSDGGDGGADSSPDSWPVYVELSNGKVLGADLVVSAIGVEPNTDWLPDCIERAPDQGLSVGQDLQTSVSGIYAAGDCCTVQPGEQASHWFQMRLWTQARLMGMFAAHSMAGLADNLGSGFNFELFTHVTRFMGQKVVLLGLYNGQKLEGEPASDIVMYSRDAGTSFVRVLLLRGRMQGAVLIGETDLEEMCENLILDGLDIGCYGPALLDPDFELDHVFD